MEYNFYKVDTNNGPLYNLDVGKVSDSEYDILKPIIEHLGGHWREKIHCFVFGEDVSDKLSYYIEHGVTVSEQYRWQEETQFYPTPKVVAKRVVDLCNIDEGNSVLEPSAGRGGLLDCITVPCDIVAVEPMADNVKYLENKGYNLFWNTFEDAYSMLPLFDRVVMNPPFSSQNDIKHVMLAYSLLKPGGILVSVISENALYYNTKVSKDFIQFITEINGYIEEVPSRSFAESGTTIETVLIRLKKPAKILNKTLVLK